MSIITNNECSSCNKVYESEELVPFKCNVALNDMVNINIKMNICSNCIDMLKSKISK